MRILISGAFGFVGSHLAPFLTQKGHCCDALDLQPHASDVYQRTYTWEQLDTLPWTDYEAIIHLAGKAHDTRNVAKPEVYTQINLGLTQRLFTAAAGRVPNFLFFSSVKAAADHLAHGEILTEAAPPTPKTPYGISKQAAEDFLRAEAGGTRCLILRPAMIYGPGNKGNLNDLYRLASKPIPWPLAAFENARSFAAIGNVCAAVEALLTSSAAAGVYQVADDEALSVNDLITLIAESLGRKPRLWRLPRGLMTLLAAIGTLLHLPLNRERLAKLTESYQVSNGKLKAALGWSQMPHTAREAFKATFASFAANR